MTTITKHVDVNAPARLVYDQWTQFEDFPRFMEGVERVDQIDDTLLHWQVNIGGVDREFDAKIIEQQPDRRIAWTSTKGEDHAGIVNIEDRGPNQSRVELRMTYDTDTWTEKVADFLNIIEGRVQGDLERFRDFIEEREGEPTGSWRGEIHGGQSER